MTVKFVYLFVDNQWGQRAKRFQAHMYVMGPLLRKCSYEVQKDGLDFSYDVHVLLAKSEKLV